MISGDTTFAPIASIAGLWRYSEKGCNSYALIDGGHAIAIDASGDGLFDALEAQGISVDAAFITHPEKENIRGLYRRSTRVLAPVPARKYLSREDWEVWKTRPTNLGIWDNYDMPDEPLECAEYILAQGACDFQWRGFRIQALPTPGHTPSAMTLLIHWNNHFLGFCGDAAAEGGTLWHPHHLEWNHWSAEGLRAAAQGVDRLCLAGCDALLPSHGAPILEQCTRMLQATRRRLQTWIEAKEAFAKGTRVSWLEGEPVGAGVAKMTPWLYQVGTNGYLVLSGSRRAIVVDPNIGEWDLFQTALRHSNATRIHAILATHYHADHAGALDEFRDRSGAEIWLTPTVSEILQNPQHYELPFRPAALSKKPERILEFDRPVLWDDFEITAWDFPGQTRAHSAFLFRKTGRSLLFSGDNFFPPERWYGSGGCCVANRTCPEFYAQSATRVLKEQPDWICAGHRAAFAFSKAYFQRVLRWAKAYRRSIEQLQHNQDRSGYREIRAI